MQSTRSVIASLHQHDLLPSGHKIHILACPCLSSTLALPSFVMGPQHLVCGPDIWPWVKVLTPLLPSVPSISQMWDIWTTSWWGSSLHMLWHDNVTWTIQKPWKSLKVFSQTQLKSKFLFCFFLKRNNSSAKEFLALCFCLRLWEFMVASFEAVLFCLFPECLNSASCHHGTWLDFWHALWILKIFGTFSL